MLNHKVLLVFEYGLVGLRQVAMGDTVSCRRRGGEGRGRRERVGMQRKQV